MTTTTTTTGEEEAITAHASWGTKVQIPNTKAFSYEHTLVFWQQDTQTDGLPQVDF